MIACDLTPTIYTEATMRAFDQAARAAGVVANLHLKVDTGMHRYGVPAASVVAFIDLIDSLSGVQLQGLWTHFAVADPSPGLAHLVELEPAISWKSRVGLTKRLRAGEAISYGQRYTMPEDGFVSTVPCGYADGLRRLLSNKGEVLIRGKRFRICGTITMDPAARRSRQNRIKGAKVR